MGNVNSWPPSPSMALRAVVGDWECDLPAPALAASHRPHRMAMSEEKLRERVRQTTTTSTWKWLAGQLHGPFQAQETHPLSKLLKAYCKRQGWSMTQIRFSFDGQPINETDVPAHLEMEDEDTIDVFQQQTGRLSVDQPSLGVPPSLNLLLNSEHMTIPIAKELEAEDIHQNYSLPFLYCKCNSELWLQGWIHSFSWASPNCYLCLGKTSCKVSGVGFRFSLFPSSYNISPKLVAWMSILV